MLFCGPLEYNASHQHGAPVYLAGIYGPFLLRLQGTPWFTCRTAVIPAGVLHELELGGYPLAVFYIEPHIGGMEALAPLVRNAREINGVLTGTDGEVSLLRELYEDPASPRWIGQAVNSLVEFSKPRAARDMDMRVARAVETLCGQQGELTPVAELAHAAGLSPSRFQHLFTEHAGVPFRRYRAWNRIRMAIREIVGGSNYTTAAHSAGYTDSAHFAHDFRRTFGAPASQGLTRVRI
jgi:AraC-like DNA-binding protein